MSLRVDGTRESKGRRQADPGAAALLALLLGACQRSAPAPEGPFAGVSDPCPQVTCVARPAGAPSAPAPGFADCEAAVDVPLASRPGPQPLSEKATRERRGRGDAAACCYDAPRLCGGGRPLVVAGKARAARVVAGGWG